MKTKLAKPARKIRAFHTATRQVRTEYRGGHVGHSRTTQGALRAAVMRIANGEFAGSNKRFSETLANRGFQRANSNKARGFRGLALRQAQPQTSPMEF